MNERIAMGGYAPLSALSATALALVLAVAIDAKTAVTPNSNGVVAATGEVSCSDFLAQLSKKPQALEFVSCKTIVQSGTPALEASYRVAGSDAAAVETYFAKSARMPRLRFLCCGWESLPASPKSQARTGAYIQYRRRFEITMTSGESMVNQRRRWAEIPYFQVKVTTYTELP